MFSALPFNYNHNTISIHDNKSAPCSVHGAKAACSSTASGETASNVDKHAVVLGLKAFVLCTPYDVPAWLPEVLMVLTQAASQPAPIKVTVR